MEKKKCLEKSCNVFTIAIYRGFFLGFLFFFFRNSIIFIIFHARKIITTKRLKRNRLADFDFRRSGAVREICRVGIVLAANFYCR